MGHYSDDYEYDAQQARKRKKQISGASYYTLVKVKYSLPSDTPQRYKDSLEDLILWLYVEKGKS